MDRLAPALALLLVASSADAQVITLRFDEVPGATTTAGAGVPIGNFYDGGGGPATDFGVEIIGSVNALCLRRSEPFCLNTNVSRGNDPAAEARGTHRAAMVYSDTPIFNLDAGFASGFSLFYTNPNGVPTTVEVWGEVGATGALLNSFALGATPAGGVLPGCFGGNFCPFLSAGVSFAGVARSVRFIGGAGAQLVADDLTFGSVTPAAVIPEPSAIVLVATGLLAIGGIVRRRRSTQQRQSLSLC